MNLAILVVHDKWQEFDSAWNELMVGEEPLEPLLTALKIAGEKKRISRCMPQVREHVQGLIEAGRQGDAARIMGAALVAGGSPSELGASLPEVASAAWGKESWWPGYSALTGLGDPARDLRKSWVSFDKLRTFQPGSLVYHPGGWGTGEILEVREESRELLVRFQNGRRDTFPMSGAIDIFDYLPEEDLRARHFRDPEGSTKALKKEPLEGLRAVVERYNGRTTLASLKNALAQVGIDGSAWSAWWRKARKEAEGSPWFRVTGAGTRAEIRLLVEASDPAQELHKQLQNLGSLEAVLARASDQLGTGGADEAMKAMLVALLAKMAQDTEEPAELRVGAWLLIREQQGTSPEPLLDLLRAYAAEPDPADTTQPPALWALFSRLRTSRDQERAIGLLPELFGEDWAEVAVQHLQFAPAGMVRILIDQLLAAKKHSLLADHYRELLARPLRAPAVLIGLAKVAESGKLEGDWPSPVQRAQALLILAAQLWSERRADPTAGRVHTRMVELLTGGREPLLERLLEDADRGALRSIQLICQRGVEEAIDNLVMVLSSRHGAGGQGEGAAFWDSDSIWTTRAGLARIASELKELKEVKVPANEAAIGRAVALGDISENAEWEAAIEEQRNLAERVRNLEGDIRKAALLEDATLPENTVAPGTRVRYRNTSSGETLTLTLLGPWDTEGREDVISYRAPLAQGLLGLHKGQVAKVALPAGEIEVEVLQILTADID